MNFIQLLFLVIISGVFWYPRIETAKILGVFPTASKSHYIVGSALMKALAEKGHEVTVISPFPQSNPLENFRDITTTDIWKATERFAHHFKAPCIGLSTFGASKWTTDLVGTPAPPSFVPNPFLSLTDRMSFSERMLNFVMSLAEVLVVRILDYPVQNQIYQNTFPDPKPSLQELKNTAVSAVLLNNHFSLSYPRPYATGMIEVGGMHINRNPKPLPDDIQRYMDDATDGIIYFSMGSNIKSKDLPDEKRKVFLNVFSKLKQKVLWKWEDDKLPSKPDNVRIQNWWPQDDILAHPNVRLFITHGGLLSTTESLYHGVPVIGIPVFGDQNLNMAKAERGGYGLSVPYQEISEERLSAAINAILGDSTFKQNAQVMSQRYRDQPVNPLDLAVFWVEYIIRHKGAPHIRTASMDLNFIQYHNLDVLAVLVGIPVIVILLLSRLICKKKTPRKNDRGDRKKRN
ncbi:UDP-glycosyltransferase UGT5-like isoform X2 [Wyeomyia smithii]|uniref:UDP-glycosyltransferase UGT5-like isoform X2 n=1 Tax=Wyeomyia smithii TaxID=174621 RepID=UPI00246800F9|nr:UDP-glycosyltransferase UGT5-like isoform X2 [Wyeomyia smithii]